MQQKNRCYRRLSLGALNLLQILIFWAPGHAIHKIFFSHLYKNTPPKKGYRSCRWRSHDGILRALRTEVKILLVRNSLWEFLTKRL